MINFTELYYKQIDNLFAFGTKFTSDREMIKDCIQDVFVKLYTKRGELDTVTNLESYLYVSLRNRINDEFRRNSHLCDSEIDDSNMKLFNEKSDNYEMLESHEEEMNRSNTIIEYVKCLSPRQQQIINLYYIEQRKYDDICQIMGINYQSVRNLMHRSLLKLRCLASKSAAV
ncbi:MAG: sigma-70 family RNA polymerase sigma factor [Prevotellaceae bacterium]|nr:sigma-70 family RNA polymerase sigma factor [Prevotellaceae bacterium]